MTDAVDADDCALRAAAATAAADRTAGPVTGQWVRRIEWEDGERYDRTHPTIGDATLEGRQLSCCAGARRVWVYGPDGSTHATWDRQNNFWIPHTDDARACEQPNTPR